MLLLVQFLHISCSYVHVIIKLRRVPHCARPLNSVNINVNTVQGPSITRMKLRKSFSWLNQRSALFLERSALFLGTQDITRLPGAGYNQRLIHFLSGFLQMDAGQIMYNHLLLFQLQQSQPEFIHILSVYFRSAKCWIIFRQA